MTMSERYELKKQLLGDLKKAMRRVRQLQEDITRVENGLNPIERDEGWIPPFLRKAHVGNSTSGT